MPTFCAIKNCGTRGGLGIPMYRFPSRFTNHGRLCQLSCERLNKWIQAINRDDLTESHIKYERVCGKHFISGKKAELYDTSNPDWIPSLNLGYKREVSSPVEEKYCDPLEDHQYFINTASTEIFCRLCLNQHKNYVPLFENNGVEMMEALTSMTISIDDPAPNVACESCFRELKRTYTTQQRLIKIESSLQEKFSTIKTESEEVIKPIKIESIDSESDTISLSEEALINDRIRECTNTVEDFWSTHNLEKPSETMKCRICPQEVRLQDYRAHRKTHSDGYCHYCGVTRKHINSLRNHVLTEHREPKQTCNECGMTFNNKHNYDIHVRRAHTLEAKYMCHVCGAEFFSGSASTLNKHILEKHSDAPKYTCDVCGKNFKKKFKMVEHKIIHSNNDPFVCEFCGKRFKFRCNINLHKRNVHGWSDVETDKCGICGKGFASKKGLLVHLSKHRKDKKEK